MIIIGYITIDSTTVRATSITQDPQLQRPYRPIIGSGGSKTTYVGSGGRLISLECRAKGDEYQELADLYKKADKVTLVSPSEANYNGEYHIITFTHMEYRKGLFTVSMKLIEDFTYNITRLDFVNYTIIPKNSPYAIDIGDTWNPE